MLYNARGFALALGPSVEQIARHERTGRVVAYAAGLSVLVILGLMVALTTRDAMPVFQYQGVWDFFTGTEWRAGFSRTEFTGDYGAWPFIYGTVVASAIAVVVAVPLAIAVSLYINRLAPARLKNALAYTVELLAAIPSVVYGLFGLLFFAPVFIRPAMELLSAVLGPVPRTSVIRRSLSSRPAPDNRVGDDRLFLIGVGHRRVGDVAVPFYPPHRVGYCRVQVSLVEDSIHHAGAEFVGPGIGGRGVHWIPFVQRCRVVVAQEVTR
jgi:hypothetical protein